jgi:hypothetical protein
MFEVGGMAVALDGIVGQLGVEVLQEQLAHP